jgi:hypothetical protein
VGCASHPLTRTRSYLLCTTRSRRGKRYTNNQSPALPPRTRTYARTSPPPRLLLADGVRECLHTRQPFDAHAAMCFTYVSPSHPPQKTRHRPHSVSLFCYRAERRQKTPSRKKLCKFPPLSKAPPARIRSSRHGLQRHRSADHARVGHQRLRHQVSKVFQAVDRARPPPTPTPFSCRALESRLFLYLLLTSPLTLLLRPLVAVPQ